jgi:hypothetical protein
MERALRVDRLVSGAIRITSHGGAGGTIGLAGFARATGEGNCLLVFAFLGAYAANGSVGDLGILLIIGLVGYVMRVYDFPVVPVLVGMILSPSPSSSFAGRSPSARATRRSS